MSEYHYIERARLAQQFFDITHDVQLEIKPGWFMPIEWATETEISDNLDSRFGLPTDTDLGRKLK